MSQDVTVTIAGTNDAPTILGTTAPTGAVTEDQSINGANSDTCTASGHINFTIST